MPYIGTTLVYGLNYGHETGRLTMGSFASRDGVGSWHNPAFCLLNLLPLWVATSTRNESLIIPGAQGQRPPDDGLTIDEASVKLPLAVCGKCDPEMTPYANEWEGLEANLAVLDSFVGPLQSATLEMPSGAIRTADLLVESVSVGANVLDVVRCTLAIRIPNGRFE